MKVLFINVDTQKDFMEKEGALYVKDAESINDNLQKLTKFAKEYNISVVNTMDFHSPNSMEISDKPDFINTFPTHCIAGTEGSEFISATNHHQFGRESYYVVRYDDKEIDKSAFNKARNVIIYKDKFDVFAGNCLSEVAIKSLNPNTIFVYGVTSQICVNYAVIGLRERGYKVVVIKDAIKELPNLPLETILKVWEEKGVILETTDNVINNLSKIL